MLQVQFCTLQAHLLNWLPFHIGKHPHMATLDFKVKLKDLGCSESYGIVGSMQNWNAETPG